MQNTQHPGWKRLVRAATLCLVVGAGTLGMGSAALAQRGGGGSGGGGGADTTATGGILIKLSNFNQNYNGASAKGQVTLGYAADGSAQSITYNLSQINVPDGTVLPVQVVTGVYKTVVSYYTYLVLEYTTTPGTVTVYHKSVTLSLNKSKGDVVPDFPAPTVGTTEIRIYAADNSREILGGTSGSLHP